MASNKILSIKQLLITLGAFLGLGVLGGIIIAGIALPVVASTGVLTNSTLKLFNDLPTKVDFTQPSQQSVILASDGSEIAKFYAENRIVVSSENISKFIKNAAVAIEDERFYEHNGIDAQGVAGAAINNLAGGNLAGGSTITQQYVKNALIEEGRIANDPEQIAQATETTLRRKINEARYAVAIESQMSKDEILTAYLNIAQFGPSQWGVETAAQYFYSVSAKDVTLEQAAMLVGATQAPNKWNPIESPKLAKERRDIVLTQMEKLGYITKAQRDKAISVPIKDMLKVNPEKNGCASAGNMAYFCETVVRDFINSNLYGKTPQDRVRLLYRGGIQIISTLDPKMQKAAHDSLVETIPTNDASSLENALTAIEPGTGKVLAMAQNTTFGKPTDKNPNATTLNLNVGKNQGGGDGFQSGSTFKIFTLVQWLKEGNHANAIVNNTHRTFPASSWKISCAPEYAASFAPYNNFKSVGGRSSVITAARQSYNVSFTEMANRMDLCDITTTAQQMGVQRGELATSQSATKFSNLGAIAGKPLPLLPNPSMVLGTNPVTPLSMANAVATLAADGKACTPITFTEIQNKKGETLVKQNPTCTQALEEEIARRTTTVLRYAVSRGSVGVTGNLGYRPVAGKTGTTNSGNHLWFVGYTPQLATAVWTGHMDKDVPGTNVRVNGRYYRQLYGSNIAAPVFRKFNLRALDGKPILRFNAPRYINIKVEKTEEEKKKEAEEKKKKEEAERKKQANIENSKPSQPKPVAQKEVIPLVHGKTKAEATAILRKAGYIVEVSEHQYKNRPAGTVIATSPGPGKHVPVGTKVTIIVVAPK